jgi:hypothetical protein
MRARNVPSASPNERPYPSEKGGNSRSEFPRQYRNFTVVIHDGDGKKCNFGWIFPYISISTVDSLRK